MQDFVVIDVETTGVLRRRDRVIEIGMIRVRDNEIVDELTTLVNPNRDLGPTHIHGITAAQVSGAPRFDEIVPDVMSFLADAVVVAHNADFDIGMLGSELERAGIKDIAPPRICTLSLAYQFGPTSRRLESCCEHFGIQLRNAHDAYADAFAAWALFQCYRTVLEREGLKINSVPAFKNGSFVKASSAEPTGKRRLRSEPVARKSDYVLDLVKQLPDAGTIEAAKYYATLDRALEDRRITTAEAADLLEVARQVGLSRDGALRANEDYVRNLVAVALSDGKITPAERADLDVIAELLGVDQPRLQKLIGSAKTSSEWQTPDALPYVGNDLAGKTVCFTGTLLSKLNGQLIKREQALEMARRAGLVPTDSLTKKTEILVIADPDSMSGKAKKAREYGTRIMAEKVFWRAIGIDAE